MENSTYLKAIEIRNEINRAKNTKDLIVTMKEAKNVTLIEETNRVVIAFNFCESKYCQVEIDKEISNDLINILSDEYDEKLNAAEIEFITL